jgi:hypothetical protein
MTSSFFSNKLMKRVIMIVDRSSLVIPWHDVQFVLLSLVVACLVNQGLLTEGHHMASSWMLWYAHTWYILLASLDIYFTFGTYDDRQRKRYKNVHHYRLAFLIDVFRVWRMKIWAISLAKTITQTFGRRSCFMLARPTCMCLFQSTRKMAETPSLLHKVNLWIEIHSWRSQLCL